MATVAPCRSYANRAFVNDQDGRNNSMLASPEEIPSTGLPPLNSSTVCRPFVIANNSQISDVSPSEPPASLTNEAMECDRPSNISGAISSSTFNRTAKMATVAPCRSYANRAFVNDHDGRNNLMLASSEETPSIDLPPLNSATVCGPLVIANNSQNSDGSPSEPPASPINEAMESDRPSTISENSVQQPLDPSFFTVSNLSSSGSSSDSQPQTGITFLSALPLGLRGFSYGSRHDGGTSSTGEPAALFSNGSVQRIRHLFPSGSSSANDIGKNPIYIEEPDLDEAVPIRPTAIIPNGIPRTHIEKNSVSPGLSENLVGADPSVDLKHRVASGSHRHSERNEPVRRGQSGTLVEADHSVDLKHGVACSFKRRLSVCIPICLVLVFCGAVAVVVTFLAVPGFQRHFLTKANVQMRVSDKFQPSMVNVSSPESVEYGNLFCHHLTQTIIKGMEVEAVDNCTVTNLRNGSIIVDAQVNVLTNQNLTADDFLHALKKTGRADGGYTMFGTVKVFSNSLNVTSVRTVEQLGEVTARKVPAEFDCSVGGALFKPFHYTYPAYCGHFQLCKDGEGIPLLCEEGLEFADDSGTTHTPCRYNSSTTYCGRKRSEDATSSTPSTTAATTSSSTTTTTTDSTKSTNATPTAEAKTTDICSSIPPPILSNDPSLYTCNSTGGYTFLPRNDTYPGNCGHYHECVSGEGIPRECANGTHFVYGDPVKACFHAGDDATFCQQMRLAQTCRQ